ncbi:MAG: hypothetical protein JRI23_03095 [Deltaproteobacteria bacterium]|nr:hypothetical protein [Deltaproteobacteria bacterium]MBW2530491.1 hypothetical protein [Deltaproteobacteria bacterium]
MSLKLWKSVAGPALMLGLAAPVLVNCNGIPGLPGGDCNELKTGDFTNFKLEGNAEATAKFKGFLEAVYTLDKLALEMEAGLIASCAELGKELGVAEAELAAEPSGGEGAKKVCAAVAAKISGTLKANAGAKLSLELGEPKCYVDIDAMTECLASCGASIDPGGVEASCEGGEIAGTCEGKCEGGCTAEGGVQCTGACEGTCEGKCDGKCEGSASTDEGGGSGECNGKCDGKCEGKCSASCKMEGEAKCEGTCSGGCDVEMKAPKCTGEFKPPNVDLQCQTNCNAKTAASASCDPPTVNIKVEGEANADVEKLVAALKVSLPKIVNIQLGMGKKMVGVVEGVVTGVAELPSAAASLGGMAALKAAACATMAVEMSGAASASINVNVEASASVGGSASGEASGEAG